MTNLYVFEKSTKKVVAVIQGPDGVSCEHAAGYIDDHERQPYCSSSLGWAFNPDNSAEVKSTTSPITGESYIDHLVLVDVENAPVIKAEKFDGSKPCGVPGGPHRMTQGQFDEQMRAQRAVYNSMAAKHGLKVTQ